MASTASTPSTRRAGRSVNSEAFYHNDGGFYIGQTPPQTKPRRSIVKGVKAWGNAIGWSGTNMRYVTITKSEFFNNSVGIIPNALNSDKFLLASDNVIADNDIFWNNFNQYAKVPRSSSQRSSAAPTTCRPRASTRPLLGCRTTPSSRTTAIYGNYLSGFGMVLDFAIIGLRGRSWPTRPADHGPQQRIRARWHRPERPRHDLRQAAGSDNCFEGNVGVSVTIPADGSTLTPCPTRPARTRSTPARSTRCSRWRDERASPRGSRHPHAPKPGYTPLELYTK